MNQPQSDHKAADVVASLLLELHRQQQTIWWLLPTVPNCQRDSPSAMSWSNQQLERLLRRMISRGFARIRKPEDSKPLDQTTTFVFLYSSRSDPRLPRYLFQVNRSGSRMRHPVAIINSASGLPHPPPANRVVAERHKAIVEHASRISRPTVTLIPFPASRSILAAVDPVRRHDDRCAGADCSLSSCVTR